MKHDKNLPNLLVERLKPDQVAIFLFHGVIKKQVNSVRNYTGKHIEEKIFRKIGKLCSHLSYFTSS